MTDKIEAKDRSRVLVVSATTGYQLRAFERVASERGVDLIYATDRCHALDDPWRDSAVPVRFFDEAGAVAAIRHRLEGGSVDGVVAVGDQATVVAAMVARAIGLPWHSPAGARASRNKALLRGSLEAHGLPTPWFFEMAQDDDLVAVAPRLRFPCVVKPLVLSGSRGVIRADDVDGFERAVARVRRILQEPDVRELRDPAGSRLLVEGYIEGPEYALEGVLDHGVLYVLAVFEKPDPLVGPYFEERMYVTPPRASEERQQAMARAVARAAAAIGLTHGPIHAECRVADDEYYVHDVAARPIGGLCAQALRFVTEHGARVSLEALLLAHTLGEPPRRFRRHAGAAGVLMIPVPAEGYFRSVQGVREASRVKGIEDIVITAKPGQRLRRLPEGASYLGFAFAHAATPGDVVTALTRAHEQLVFRVDRGLPVLAE
jgi:biotin carboxylase